MSITTISITLLQIFLKIILNSKIIVKSIIDPDENFTTLENERVNPLMLTAAKIAPQSNSFDEIFQAKAYL